MADILEDWQKSVADYWTLTGEKIPEPEFKKFFASTHLEVSKALGVCDTTFDIPCKTTEDDRAKAKAFKKAVENFVAVSKSYASVLETLIKNERAKRLKVIVEKNGVTVLEKLTSDRHKGAKMLKTRLERYQATMVNQSQQLFDVLEKTDKLVYIEKNIGLGLKAGFSKAAASSAAIKAMPTIETWNTEMDQGIRMVTTALGPWGTLKKEYDNRKIPFPDRLNAPHEHAKSWVDKLSPWASGAKRVWNLKETRTGNELKEAILDELKTAMKLVKACMIDYQAYLK